MKKNVNTVKEITPQEFRCGVGMCPSVFDTNDGNLLIIGKSLVDNEIPEMILKKIGENETVVKVPKNLIYGLIVEKNINE